MAATATSFGNGSWGIGADETGIIIESISHNYTTEMKPIKNRTGNTTGITYYDEKVKVSLDGKVPSTSPFSATIASSTTLSNALSSYLKGGVSGGLTIVEGITIDMNQEDYKSFKIELCHYPNIAS